MKKNILLLLCLHSFLIISCNEAFDQTELQLPSQPVTTRALVETDESLMDLQGIPVCIELAEPYGTGKYLGLWHEVAEQCLMSIPFILREDNLASTSKFFLMYDPTFHGDKDLPCYRLQVVGRVKGDYANSTLFLSNYYNTNERVVATPYWNEYSSFVKYRYTFVKVPDTDDQYYIVKGLAYIKKDYESMHYAILTAQGPDKESQIHYQSYLSNTSSRHLQKWKISPAETFDLANIVYSIEPNDLVSQKPDFLTEMIIRNETSLEQSMEVTFTEKATVSSSFTKTSGYKLNISSSVSTPKFLGGGGDISVSKETSNSSSFNDTETKEDQRSYKFPVRVPPRTVVNAQAAVQQYEANITYTATFRGKTSGKIFTVNGRWQGVTAGTITYTLREASTNRILKTFSETPKAEIDLTKILMSN